MKTILKKVARAAEFWIRCYASQNWQSAADARGCQGIVTSARETAQVRSCLGHKFAIVNPGIRPAGADRGDQSRVVTPAEAIAAGATHIVVGRPITEAANPAAEAEKILQEMGAVGASH